jgi:uncharacterized protein (UPF0262 family)
MSEQRNRLFDVTLNAVSLTATNANVEHERRIALFDLKESNSFAVVGEDRGPYALALSLDQGRLAFSIADAAGAPVCEQVVSMSSLRKCVKDYVLICENYHTAIRTAAPSQIEAIDMGRRGLHNEAAEMLMEALSEKMAVDLETARRLFTLVVALQARG